MCPENACGDENASANKISLTQVKELTARKRNRLFSYAGYIEIMSRGTELPGQLPSTYTERFKFSKN